MHSAYLHVMGIDVWRLRHASHSAPAFPGGYAHELLRNGQRVGFMWAASASDDLAVNQLLDKMIAALKCQGRGRWASAWDSVDDFLTGARVVIALGDGCSLSGLAVPVIESHSPQTLLAQPHLKAETWQALQAVFPLIDGCGYGLADP